MHQIRVIVPCIHVGQGSCRCIEDSPKERDELCTAGILAHQIVDSSRQFAQREVERHQRADACLNVCHQQCSGRPLAGDITDSDDVAVVVEGNHIVIIAADLLRGDIRRSDIDAGN